MVFPSLQIPIESGLLSQFSVLFVIGFSYFLKYWKKLTIAALLVLSLMGVSNKVFAFAMAPGSCGTMCVNNTNYYGQPWGSPYYYYPQLQYHSFWGPMPYYFRPHSPSPYRPMWMNNCPHCQMNNPMWGPNSPMGPVHHGPAS